MNAEVLHEYYDDYGLENPLMRQGKNSLISLPRRREES